VNPKIAPNQHRKKDVILSRRRRISRPPFFAAVICLLRGALRIVYGGSAASSQIARRATRRARSFAVLGMTPILRPEIIRASDLAWDHRQDQVRRIAMVKIVCSAVTANSNA
jgi:hypothetical protein